MIIMSPETLLKIISGLFTLVAASMAALWVYTKYILERGFLPPVNFFVKIKKLGAVGEHYIIDFKIHLHNLGSTTLIARDIRLDILYLEKNDHIEILKKEGQVGRLDFKKNIKKLWKIKPENLMPEKIKRDEEKLDRWRQRKHRGFLVLERDTFVQAEVDQTYTFVTLLPKDTICFLTWCSFQYAQKLSGWQQWISRLSRKLGLIQYTLAHAEDHHTLEEVFWIIDDVQPGNSGDKCSEAAEVQS